MLFLDIEILIDLEENVNLLTSAIYRQWKRLFMWSLGFCNDMHPGTRTKFIKVKSRFYSLKSITYLVNHVKMHKIIQTQSSMLGSTSDSGEYLLHTINTPGTLTDPFHSAAKVGCWEEGIV